MIELQQHTGKLKCENYGLWEFLLDLQQGIKQGYELDDSNEGFAQNFGSLYTCLLKKELRILPGGGLTEVVLKVDAPVDQEIAPLNKQQRKQKG